MLRYLIGFILIILLLACKEDTSQIYERKQVTGKAILADPFSESLTIPAPTATIYLATNDKADPFLYSVTADADGKFVFSGLPKDESVALLVGKYKNPAGIAFVGSMSLSAFSADIQTELLLRPQYPGGVLKFQLLDATAGNAPIAGADILIFSTLSQTSAAADADPKGAVQKGVTNAKGIVFFHSLQPITYYAVAKNMVGGKAVLSTPLPVTVTSTTLVTDVQSVTPNMLTLAYPKPVAKASIQLILKDSLDLPVAGFNAYLFTNPRQAETIKDDSISVFVQAADALTNLNGITKFSNVDPGKYYIAVSGAYSEKRKIKKVLNTQPIEISIGNVSTVPVSYTIN